jgi:hypothetical protein
MPLTNRLIQPIITQSGLLAPSGIIAVSVPVPLDSAGRLMADVILVGTSGGHVNEAATLYAELGYKNANGVASAVTNTVASSNPQNSNSTGNNAARAMSSELNAGGGAPSTAIWTVAGSTATLTITNSSTTESAYYDVSISVHHIAFQYTPEDLMPAAWYRADQGIIVAGVGENSVSAWNAIGSSDPNQNLIQNAGGAQPTLTKIDSLYNGQPTISFNSSMQAQFLVSGNWASTQVQPFTIIVVGNDSGAATAQTYWSSPTEASYFYNDGISNYLVNAGTSLVDPTTPLSNTPRVVGAVVDGATSVLYNSAKTAVASGPAGTGTIPSLAVGIFTDLTSNPLNGKLAELVVVNGVLTAGEIAALMTGYFGPRYGIVIGS